MVTLPWIKADGELVTFRLLLSRGSDLPIHRKLVNDRWKAALKRVGMPCDRHHMMRVTRHTFASSCLSEGISIRAVAECLGDTEATVQATYSHLMPDDTEGVRVARGRFFAHAADPRREASIGGDVP
jgi:site-specific recombinase XerD